MLKRPPGGPYLEDEAADPDVHEMRRGDVLMEPTAWAKDRGMYQSFPTRQAIDVCFNGDLIGKVRQGGSVAVNCRDVQRNTGAVLAGNRRVRDVRDPYLLRLGIFRALDRLKAHIDAVLESFFASNALVGFLDGHIGLHIAIHKSKFEGIGLDGRYQDFPNLDDLFQIISNPDDYIVSAQQYLDLPRIAWLINLRSRLEQYVRHYVEVHVSVASCFSNHLGIDVNFNVMYLSKMVTSWDFDANLDGTVDSGLKLKAHFSRSDARDFALRGVKFTA